MGACRHLVTSKIQLSLKLRPEGSLQGKAPIKVIIIIIATRKKRTLKSNRNSILENTILEPSFYNFTKSRSCNKTLQYFPILLLVFIFFLTGREYLLVLTPYENIYFKIIYGKYVKKESRVVEFWLKLQTWPKTSFLTK